MTFAPPSKYDPHVEQGVERVTRELAVRRAESGMSLRQLSSLTGVSGPAISRIENGERSPGLRVLIMLTSALGLAITIDKGQVSVS